MHLGPWSVQKTMVRYVVPMLCALIPWVSASAAQEEKPTPLKPELISQLEALIAEKAQRQPHQQKLDSRLVYTLKQQAGHKLFRETPFLRTLPPAKNGQIEVDISGHIDDTLQSTVLKLGGDIHNAHPTYGAMRASLPLEAVETLAKVPQVTFIQPAGAYMLQGIVTSEGDVAHGADIARNRFGVDGSGQKVAAMSDSVDALASLLGGELPSTVTVLPGQSGNPGTSEGTALLEIIHDLAPGAELLFATGSGGTAQMAQNILDLRAAGADIIVDDILYFNEPVFQDGIVAQAVEQVVADGALFVTSAGNSGNFNDGESGVWEGLFSPTTLPAPLAGSGVNAHDFGSGQNFNTITLDGPAFYTLQWNEPQGASQIDFDLFLLDPTGSTVIAASTNAQTGTANPFEIIDTRATDDINHRLVVVVNGGPRTRGINTTIHMNTHRGRLSTGTPGQIFGHPGAKNALTVGAINQQSAMGGQFIGGTNVSVETFSSDGPRTIFFDPLGNPIDGAGQPSETRQKPDVTAADGVTTTTPGFNPFFGTSASAPHAAGISALLGELDPTLSVADMIDIFTGTALDIEQAGFDRDSGAGIIMTEPALEVPIFADGFESGDASAWTK